MALPTLNVTPGTGVTINTLPPGGQANGSNSLPVILSTEDPAALALGAKADAAYTDATGAAAGSLVALFKGMFLNTAAQGAKADAAYADATGAASGSAIALLKGAFVSLKGLLTVDTVVRATAANRSGTITAGGTAQQLMAANATRRGFALQNNSTGPLYVNGVGTATSDGQSLTIAAGQLFDTSIHHVGTGAISILGATTGQAFYAREF